jgi:predicted CXXCH cytochrome family protein
VIGATPAFADNGPHISTSGNTTVDRCAGCHRAHTAKASYLLTTDQTLLCQTCHSGFGATTDVADGVSTGNGGGALRGGGFTFALINTTSGVNRTSVGTLANGAASTSKHDIGVSGTAWGGGATGTGTAITLECGSCHDPHGNGNYRILRPVPTDGTALALPAPVAVTSVTQTAVSGTTYTYTVVTAVPNTFKVTDPVTFAGSTAADVLIAATVKSVIDTSTFTVSMRSVNFASSTGGTVGYADPLAIATVSGSGTVATYKTYAVHGLVAGQAITISGILPAGYNVTKAVIASVPSVNTFTIANVTATAYTSGGKISGIADALGTKVYTTTNYWAQDDHNYTGANLASTQGAGTAASGGATAFIANISQWCSTCHTRTLAGSGAWDVNSGDAMYTFKHRSQNGKEGSPNCIQCHVAHGTNANMGGVSSSVGTEITGKAGDSFLLRVDSRGTCNMCHNL